MVTLFQTPYRTALPSLTDITYVEAANGYIYGYIPFSASSFSAENTEASVNLGASSWCSICYVQKYGLAPNVWLLVVRIKKYGVYDSMQSMTRVAVIDGVFRTENDRIFRPFAITITQIGCEESSIGGDIVIWRIENSANTDYFIKTSSWSGKKLSLNEIGSFDVTEAKMISTMCINLSGAFANQTKLVSFSAQTCDFSNVISFSDMFSRCAMLENIDISDWDFSSATSISGMFNGCQSLVGITFPQGCLSNCTNMSLLFNGCTNIANIDMTGVDTSSVTDMSNMFIGCSSLSTLDVSNFDTTNVTNMANMFSKCSNLSVLDLRNWDVANVTNFGGMFTLCPALTSIIGGESEICGDSVLRGATKSIDISQTNLDLPSIVAIFFGVAEVAENTSFIKMTRAQYNLALKYLDVIIRKHWEIRLR